jgi:3',5'-cyclic AMP phosphodiesterase CpdA
MFRWGAERIERRELLQLLALGSVASASGLIGCTSGTVPQGAQSPASSSLEDFLFLQLSDTHWGYSGVNNPEAASSLPAAVKAINASALQPDFVVFTGDLTHLTDDPAERRRRLRDFRSIIGDLKVPVRYFLPGEHDAGPDGGDAYREVFGETHQSFDHKGVHCVLLDNVSAPGSVLGDAQLEWLERDVRRLSPSTPLAVFTHRPLFDLYPSWDWSTHDGAKALAILSRHPSATVFYGHIHQIHHVQTGNIAHHAARSLIFPLPAPGSVPKKTPLPWDAAAQDHGLGYRSVAERAGKPQLEDVALQLAPRTGAPA